MTTTTEALRLAREALRARDTYGWSTEADAALERMRSALSAIDKVPSVDSVAPAKYLFVQMDDDHRAWHRWCADVAEAREAVKAAMFFVSVGEELSAEHIDQLDASVDVLLEDGRLTFEGDPPLHLYRMGSAAWQKAATPQAQPATPPAVQAQTEPQPTRADLIAALTFYGRGDHMQLSDQSAWDTVSGEPQNWWCDEAGTATIEDGTIAKRTLSGDLTAADIDAMDEDDDGAAAQGGE